MSYQSWVWVVPVYVGAPCARHLTDDEAAAYLVVIAIEVVILLVIFWRIRRLGR